MTQSDFDERFDMLRAEFPDEEFILPALKQESPDQMPDPVEIEPLEEDHPDD